MFPLISLACLVFLLLFFNFFCFILFFYFTMDASVQDIWTAARGSRFAPAIGKETHFTVGFSLVLVSVLLAAAFTLSASFFFGLF